jgi:hypothetical protein
MNRRTYTNILSILLISYIIFSPVILAILVRVIPQDSWAYFLFCRQVVAFWGYVSVSGHELLITMYLTFLFIITIALIIVYGKKVIAKRS